MGRNPKNRLLYERINFILTIFCFLSLLFCAYGFANSDNYIDFVSYCALSAFVGITFGVLFAVALYKIFPSAANYESRKETPLIFLSCIAFSLFSIGFMRVVNEWSIEKSECNNYRLIKTESVGSKYKSYHAFIQNGERIERLQFPKDYIDQIRNSDSIYLCINTGLLGFVYFKPSDNSNHDN